MRRRRPIAQAYQQLEKRELLAGVFLNNSTGELTIFGDVNDNVADARVVGTNVRVNSDVGLDSFPLASVSSLTFIGFGGDDNYTNNTAISASMFGQAGNDTLTGGIGDDVIIGGAGNDTLVGNDGNDRLVGAAGIDDLDGGNGNDSLFASSGGFLFSNTLVGGPGNDIIFGSDSRDNIFGGDGIDKIYALGDNDTIDSGDGGVPGSSGTDQADLVLGLGGNDTITGGGGLNVFWGGDGNDTLTGGSGENRIHGQNGDDTIVGGARNDFLRGQNGNDSIASSGGNDTVDFGVGNDETITYQGNYRNFSANSADSGLSVVVSSVSNSDTILNADWLEFNDRRISPDQATLGTFESLSYGVTNNYRNSQNLPIFSHPGDLTAYAEIWAADMRNNGLRHSPDADLSRLLVGGRTQVDENIGFIADVGQGAAAAARAMHNVWINDPIDRQNLINGAFTEIGIGIVYGGGGWGFVHVFTDATIN